NTEGTAQTNKNGANRKFAPLLGKERFETVGLNGLRCRTGRRRGRGARERTGAGFLFTGLVDFDGTFEVRAVFNHDAGGGKVAVDGAILLNLDTVLGAQVSLHRAVDHNFAGDNIRGQLGRGANRQFALVKLHQTLDRSIDCQVFVSRDFTLYMQT